MTIFPGLIVFFHPSFKFMKTQYKYMNVHIYKTGYENQLRVIKIRKVPRILDSSTTAQYWYFVLYMANVYIAGFYIGCIAK